MDRLTFSDANEIDPAMTPDGCGVVFASDQGRGLGSSALYLMDFSRIIGGCDRSSLVAGRR
jgi:Tol biopolymer transport system component